MKAGRFYVPIDVNWYDEWGHAVSHDAALLWVLAVGQAKRMQSPVLTLSQLRRIAPINLTPEYLLDAVCELIGCDIAPISGDTNAIVLHGWDAWNDGNDASKSGAYGNHIRWHVNEQKHDPTCAYCLDDEPDRPDIAPISPPDRLREEKRREEKNKEDARLEESKSDFEECWKIYPRRDRAKAKGLEKYILQRKAGVPKEELFKAVQNFAKTMSQEERPMTAIMYAARFFGRDNEWAEYLTPPPDPSEEKPAGAGRMFANDEERDKWHAQFRTGGEVDLDG